MHTWIFIVLLCQQCSITVTHGLFLGPEKQSYTAIWAMVVTGWPGNGHFHTLDSDL